MGLTPYLSVISLMDEHAENNAIRQRISQAALKVTRHLGRVLVLPEPTFVGDTKRAVAVASLSAATHGTV